MVTVNSLCFLWWKQDLLLVVHHWGPKSNLPLSLEVQPASLSYWRRNQALLVGSLWGSNALLRCTCHLAMSYVNSMKFAMFVGTKHCLMCNSQKSEKCFQWVKSDGIQHLWENPTRSNRTLLIIIIILLFNSIAKNTLLLLLVVVEVVIAINNFYPAF